MAHRSELNQLREYMISHNAGEAGRSRQGWRTVKRRAEADARAAVEARVALETASLGHIGGKVSSDEELAAGRQKIKGLFTSYGQRRQGATAVRGARRLDRARARYSSPEEALGGVLSKTPNAVTRREWGQVKPLFKELIPGKHVEAALPRNEAGAINKPRLNSFTKRIKGKTGQSVSYSVDEFSGKVYFSIGEQAKATRGKTNRSQGTKAGSGTNGKTARSGPKKGRGKAGGLFGLSQGIGGFINDMADRAAAGGFENVASKLLRPWGAALSDKKRYKPWLGGTLYGAYTGYAMIADGDQPLALG